MALYRYDQYIVRSNDAAFDRVHSPGTPTPFSGIYRCEGCTREVASNAGNPLPPQNSHQHTNSWVPIQWRLVVSAQTNG